MAKRLLASKALAQLRSIFISPDYPDKDVIARQGQVSVKVEPGSGTEKNYLQILNQEFGQGKPIDFQFEFVGSLQSPSYKALAQIEGISFEAVGGSKVEAKRALARKAVSKLKNEPLPEDVSGSVNLEDKYNPFDVHRAPLPINAFSGLAANSLQVLGAQKPKVDAEKAKLHPYMVLCETYPDINLEWADEVGRGDHKFKVEALVDGVSFFGEGRSKKLAKINLAKSVLLCLHDVSDFADSKDCLRLQTTSTEPTEKAPKKKFVLTQLRDLVGEDLSVEVEKQEDAAEDSAYYATVVANGTAFEAVAKNKFTAKIKAAKKALEALQPKKVVDLTKVDVSHHPNMAFQDHFKNVRFNDSENVKEDGSREFSLEATIEGRKFRTSGPTKKKAKLRLVLKAFEVLKNVAPTRWAAIDLNAVNAQ